MKPRLKIISAERGIHIIDGLLSLYMEGYMGSDGKFVSKMEKNIEKRDETLNILLHDITKISHICCRTSCERVHQSSIPRIRELEKMVIKAGHCTPLNRRGWKARVREHNRHTKSIEGIRS